MKKYRVTVHEKDGVNYSLTYRSRKGADACADLLKKEHANDIESITIEELN